MDTKTTAHTLPRVFGDTGSVTFISLIKGQYRNTYELTHDVNGQNEAFGTMVESSEHPRLFCLGDTEYTTYTDFAAAYYAQYPERIAMNSKV